MWQLATALYYSRETLKNALCEEVRIHSRAKNQAKNMKIKLMFPVVSHFCQTWSFILKQGQKLHKVFRQIFL
jgi:hypothetical protein